MTDLAHYIADCCERYKGDLLISVALTDEQWQQIITALRRSNELAQAQARCAELEKFRKFVGLLLFDYCENWGTDIGGDMIEEYLLKSGLAARDTTYQPP